MEIESQLTKSDLMKLLARMTFLRTTSIIVIVLALLLFLTMDNIILPIIYLALILLLFGTRILRFASTSNNRNFTMKLKIIFTDEQISIDTPLSSESMKWEALMKWKRVAGYYLLYSSNVSFFVLKRSAIPLGRVDEFEAMLAQKIGKQ